MRKIILLSLSVLISGCAGPKHMYDKAAVPSAEPGKVIRVGVYQNKPAVFIMPDGQVQGLSITPLIEAAKANNWELKFETCYWAQCLMWLEKGDIDLMVDIAYTHERAVLYDFSQEPVFYTWGQVYQKPGAQLTINDLAGKTVAAMQNDVHNIGPDGIRKMLAAAGVDCEVLETESYKEVFEAIASGEADAGIVPSMWGAENAAQFGLVQAGIQTNKKEIRYAVKKGGDQSVLSAIDATLKSLATAK